MISAITWLRAYYTSLQRYFSTSVWMPSIALQSIHFSVLSWSGVLTVFLVQSGFTLNLIMWGEILSAIFELSSTVVYPWGIRVLSIGSEATYVALKDQSSDPDPSMDENDHEGDDHAQASAREVDQRVGASRLGLVAILQMLLSLVRLLPNSLYTNTQLHSIT